MSDLSRPKECAEWIHSWEGETRISRDPRGATERWIRKLEESISFFSFEIRQCESTGRWPSYWKPDDVRMSLAMLQEARERAIEKLSGL